MRGYHGYSDMFSKKINDYPFHSLKYYGNDVYIADTVKIKRPHLVKIGNHVAIDDYSVFTTGLDIGDYCHLSYNVSSIGGEKVKLVMEHFTTISTGARIICATDELHGEGLVSVMIPKMQRDNVIYGDVILRRFSAVSSNCVIMPKVEIPEGCVIGANSLVLSKQKLDAWGIYVGSPVMKIGERRKDEMIEKAKELGYYL